MVLALPINREAFLERIGLGDAPPPTEAGLEALHRAHTYSLPFENFDIHLGRGISLAPERLFDKLIRHRRGGYCFELNGLFGMALDAFGFRRRPLLGRVHFMGRLTGRAHMVNLVELDGRRWLADVGFGSGQVRAPLPLERGRVATHDGVSFRLVDGGDFGTMVQTLDDEGWKDMYSFDMAHVWPIDIEMGNYFTSHHPGFFFTTTRVAVRTTPRERVTLADFRLREFTDGGVTETILPPGPAYLAAVEAKFGIVLDEPYEALKPVGQPDAAS